MAATAGARLVIRLDRLMTDYGDSLPEALALLEDAAMIRATYQPLLVEAVPTIKAFAASLAQVGALLDDAAPLLRQLLPVIHQATPTLRDLAPLGEDLVPALAAASPGLQALAPMLESLAPVVEDLPELTRRLSSDLSAVGSLADPDLGMAAVAANTSHLVELMEDLSAQLQAIPGASLLRRRNTVKQP